MKASELRELNNTELEEKLKSLKEELFNLRFQLAINQLENPMRISAVKKDIARVQTIMRQNELQDSTTVLSTRFIIRLLSVQLDLRYTTKRTSAQ